MDKHERPYTCIVNMCPKQQAGFTYTGGLRRHYKEVHRFQDKKDMKNDKEKLKTFTCPHPSCVRHSQERGFMRQENLSEHVRRVHTGVVPNNQADAQQAGARPAEAQPAETQPAEAQPAEAQPARAQRGKASRARATRARAPAKVAGQKRKAEGDLREENKRLVTEIKSLREKVTGLQAELRNRSAYQHQPAGQIGSGQTVQPSQELQAPSNIEAVRGSSQA